MPAGKPRSKAKPQSSTKPRFYDHDPYRLPDMDFESKVAEASRSALDPRLVTAEEMQTFISEMAPSDFDLTSEEFRSLPTEVQYEIVGDLRLRSRQTSFKRLQNMLKNSETPLDFSKEQIKGLKERNHLTQQLLTTTDTIGKAHVEIPIRITGERNREYVLIKNEGEGKGWILGMRDAGTRDQPIIVDDPSRDGVKPKDARDKEKEAGSEDDEMEEVRMLVFTNAHNVHQLIATLFRPAKHTPSAPTIPQDQEPRRYKSGTAVAKQQKPFGRLSPAKARSAVFPRRPSGSKPGGKTVSVPLFVPDEEDGVIPQVTGESEGDEWEDFDGELEEDVQMSIAIAESLEPQRQSRRIPDLGPPARMPVLETPVKTPRQTDTGDREKAVTDEEFVSPSRLATQLSIAGARKPLSTRTPSDSVRGIAPLVTNRPSASPRESAQSLIAVSTQDRHPAVLDRGDTDGGDESDEDDDMEEVPIPQTTDNYLHIPAVEPILEPPGSPVNTAPASDHMEKPLAIGVEDVIAKRFAEIQKVFAEKRRAFQAENLEMHEDMRQKRELLRVESLGLEYADGEVIEVQEKVKEVIEVRSSPPPQSDEDEDMEEVEVIALPPVPYRIPQPSIQPQPLQASIPAVVKAHKSFEEKAEEGNEEDVPISDWSRSPSPRPRPSRGGTSPSASVPTLDRLRGLLDPDDSFDQGLSGEQDQEHEDFDAAHEMDPDAEAGEFARWMSQVKGRNLDDVRKEIEQEIKGLQKEQKAAMRDSEDITGQMIAQIMVSLRNPSYA